MEKVFSFLRCFQAEFLFPVHAHSAFLHLLFHEKNSTLKISAFLAFEKQASIAFSLLNNILHHPLWISVKIKKKHPMKECLNCQRSESNWRHKDFQSSALPAELHRQLMYKTICFFIIYVNRKNWKIPKIIFLLVLDKLQAGVVYW